MSDRPTAPASAPRLTDGDAVEAPREEREQRAGASSGASASAPARASASAPASAPARAPARAKDLVFVGGRTDSGGLRVLRSRDDRLEIGEMRAPKEGQPLMGELVRLQPTEEHEQLFECETLVEAPTRTAAGPPQVASNAYRSGWEQIFGGEGHDPSELN